MEQTEIQKISQNISETKATMKRPVIIVFTIILAIHLLALALFLTARKNNGKPEDKKDIKDASGPAELSVSEPVIDRNFIDSNSAGNLLPQTLPAGKTNIKTTRCSSSAPFFIRRDIPSFDFRSAVKGNIPAVPESVKAGAGILVDIDSGKVLWSKNATAPVPIASMTKIMTALLAFEDIRNGKASYDMKVKVTKSAQAIHEGEIWLDTRETFPLKDLLKAMLIKSANDAAELVAEALAHGDVKLFVKRMNAKSAKLGLKHTEFYNPHGLPGKSAKTDNVASCEDVAILAAHLMQYPGAMEIVSSKMATIPRKIGRNKKTVLTSTNHLIRNSVPGVDGMKTGYTKRAGSCLTATCKRNGRRLIAVVTGFQHRADRDVFVTKLLNWGYNRK